MTKIQVEVEADTRPFEAALDDLKQLSDAFGAQLTGAMKSAAMSGRSLDDVLRRIGISLAGMALSTGLAPMQELGSSMFSSFADLLKRALPFEKGGVVSSFAAGGVVSSPTLFPLGSGLGLMGEAGAEAILPLSRGADGRLGVATGGGAAPVNIVFNVTTPDAQSFRKSEAQVTGMLARAVSRGSRTF
ncbi:phage tail tape measure protein [Aquamicrobium sp. LC103]|uniref:phage tail tape measure protein n=1 Tax=Aquamicrobium sp. LC103 TaxID=1120658 RepID=UPI00063E9E1D|nr:phage tail tape measure protein [Aquamicrobium sp. LC103]TKT81233.1 phage tail tape measure protein [Aquamicrobium sp. LC103]